MSKLNDWFELSKSNPRTYSYKENFSIYFSELKVTKYEKQMILYFGKNTNNADEFLEIFDELNLYFIGDLVLSILQYEYHIDMQEKKMHIDYPIDRYGFNRHGFDRDGFDRDGYDTSNMSRFGLNRFDDIIYLPILFQ